jgi:hypothetical protein
MARRIRACAQIAAGFAVVFTIVTPGAQAQPPVVYVEDCGKAPVFVCAGSGQSIGGTSHPMRVIPFRHARHGFYPSYDQPTRDREWLWNDP